MEIIEIEMDEQALLGLNPNADADFRQIENIYMEKLPQFFCLFVFYINFTGNGYFISFLFSCI